MFQKQDEIQEKLLIFFKYPRKIGGASKKLQKISKTPLIILVFLPKSIYLPSELNPAAFFVNANMVRIPEPLVVVFLVI